MTETVSESTATHANAAPPGTDVVAALARELRRARPGTLAPLRRVHPLRDGQGALFESEWLLQAAGVQPADARRERWALLLHSMALAQGRHAGGRDHEPGRVLAQLRVSEARVKQLVEADFDVLCDLVPRLARRLAAAGASVDWWPLAELLLYAGTAQEPRADVARRRIVREYLKAASRSAADDPAPAST